jgi:hypothetical protein
MMKHGKQTWQKLVKLQFATSTKLNKFLGNGVTEKILSDFTPSRPHSIEVKNSHQALVQDSSVKVGCQDGNLIAIHTKSCVPTKQASRCIS